MMTAPDTVVSTAESLLGCPYVYGTWGKAVCTPSLRSRYASYNPEQKAVTYARCQRLRESSPTDTCEGCKYQGKLAFDCRGFTHYCLAAAGIEITGGYVGRQWADSNWDEKGEIAALPDLVCCVFVYRNGKWKHTGLHIGGGDIFHCSGEVKTDRAVGGANKWTHYAVPKGLYTAEEIRAAHKGGFMRTMKMGSTGEDVRQLQEMLNALGYSCGTADGLFGNRTHAAVVVFQKHNGLTVDGVVGPKTWKALAAAAAGEDASGRSEEPDNDPDPDEQEGIPQPSDPMAYGDSVLVPREDLYAALRIVRELSGRLEAWVEQ